jgi:Predicted membrane protein
MAAGVTVLAAHLFRLPEAYWAAVTTLIVMQSNVEKTWVVSVRSIAGTVLGACIGALLATYFGPNVFAFGAGVFLLACSAR